MLGSLKIPLVLRRHYTVQGGPYLSRTEGTVGVKLAKEINAPCQISIPTQDFSVPKIADLDRGLEMAVRQMLAGETLYVGCMGGKGRTGLFLAILAKAFGVKKPIEYVRKNYYEHAVETRSQEAFVQNYQVPRLVKIMVVAAKAKSVFSLHRDQTTKLSPKPKPKSEISRSRNTYSY